jgi:hypothetical protein
MFKWFLTFFLAVMPLISENKCPKETFEKCQKCTIYPPPKDCKECCPVKDGIVDELTDRSITIRVSDQKETFLVTTETVIKGRVVPETFVHLVYRNGTDTATLVEHPEP